MCVDDLRVRDSRWIGGYHLPDCEDVVYDKLSGADAETTSAVDGYSLRDRFARYPETEHLEMAVTIEGLGLSSTRLPKRTTTVCQVRCRMP
jgi:hypothetical protein